MYLICIFAEGNVTRDVLYVWY